MNKLTPTNRSIVELLAAGKTVKEIAAEMQIKSRTVKAKIKRLREIHACVNTTQLVAKLITNPGPDA